MTTKKVLANKQFLSGMELTNWVNSEENQSRIEVVSIVPGTGAIPFLYLFYWEWQTTLSNNTSTSPQ